MNLFFRNDKGFTLIELLVVVAIIGLLSSIVFASLQSARLKARDSAIKSQMIQFRNLLELEYSTANSYLALQPRLWANTPPSTTCDTLYLASSANPNVVNANAICKSIYASSADDSSASGYAGYRFFAGTETIEYTKSYSIMAYLPGIKRWQCMGVSGQSTVTWSEWYASTSIGCYGNP